MKITIDTQLCVGCGLCEINCSDVFKMANGIPEIQAKGLNKLGNEEHIKQAISDCPITAIGIE